jgi:hypothetical protein
VTKPHGVAEKSLNGGISSKTTGPRKARIALITLALVIIASSVSSIYAADSLLGDTGVSPGDSERVILTKLYHEISIPPRWLDTIGSYEYRTYNLLLPLPPVITYHTRSGDCDDLALLMFTAGVIAGVKNMTLVYGTINGKAHGWLEHDGFLYDLSAGRIIKVDQADGLGYVRMAWLR